MSETSGWDFERGTTESVDEHGWVIREPTDNAQFVCYDHDYDTGVVPLADAREGVRAHFATVHSGEQNPFA